MNAVAKICEPIEALAQCTRCGDFKPTDAFCKDRRRASGRSSWCRSCHTKSTRAWQAANADRVREARRTRYAAKRNDINERRRAVHDQAQSSAGC